MFLTLKALNDVEVKEIVDTFLFVPLWVAVTLTMNVTLP